MIREIKPLDRVAESDRRDQSRFALPWPPSANRIWRVGASGWSTRGKKNAPVYCSPQYEQFLNDVRALAYARQIPPIKRVDEYSISIRCYPPNGRKYDLDNRVKATLDALTKVGFWLDDSQVVEIDASKQSIKPNGEIQVVVYALKPTRPKVPEEWKRQS